MGYRENYSNNFVVCKHTNGVMTITCAIHTFVLTVHVPIHGHIKLSMIINSDWPCENQLSERKLDLVR